MCALPEKKRESHNEEFSHHFNELQNDLLNIQQILNHREKSAASFDTIAKELESLKEDAQDRLTEMNQLYNQSPSHFPKNCAQMLTECQKLLKNLHPDYLTQKKWGFNERSLSDFRKSLSY